MRTPLAHVVLVLAVLTFLSPLCADALFTRGDSNVDGNINVSDAICTQLFLFSGRLGTCVPTPCLDAHDVDDDGAVTVTDIVFVLSYLFRAGPAPAEPFVERCGQDPTPEDALDCESYELCEGVETFEWIVASGLELHSIGSADFPTAVSLQAVWSSATLRAGSYELFVGRETSGVDLIESLRQGYELDLASAVAPGRVRFEPPDTYVFTQDFFFETGMFQVDIPVSRGEAGASLDCRLTESCAAATGRRPDTDAEIDYSCLVCDLWGPTIGDDFSPLFVLLEDGTRLELHTEDLMLPPIDDDEQPRAKRRLSRAIVDFRGLLLEVTEPAQLLLAGNEFHRRQEYRVLFDEPVDDVFGLELVECPPVAAPDCGLSVIGGRVWLLDGDLERIEELLISDFNQGSADE